MAPSDSPNVHRFRPREATDSVVDDPALAEMVKQGILKAREKLIDLSMRNGILNFKHSETSSRHVRVVDERLEFLATNLASGRPLDIIPLPPVEQIPRDEDTSAPP